MKYLQFCSLVETRFTADNESFFLKEKKFLRLKGCGNKERQDDDGNSNAPPHVTAHNISLHISHDMAHHVSIQILQQSGLTSRGAQAIAST